MKTLERFWTDKTISKRIVELRAKLPLLFSRFSNADLILAWQRHSQDASVEWLSPTKKEVKQFVSSLDITEEELSEPEDEEALEDLYDDEEEDDEYLDRDRDLDFENARFPDEEDFDDKDY
jgi:hypothetical protein